MFHENIAIVLLYLPAVQLMITNYSGRICLKPLDCNELYSAGVNISSIFSIYPNQDRVSVQVLCDMETDCGGWTIIQKRQSGSQEFNRTWDDYKYGFGVAQGEYWIGNENLYQLTRRHSYELWIQLTDFKDNRRYAIYRNFSISDEASKYRLSIGSYQGNAGDALTYHNGQSFSTPDQDNDQKATSSCARVHSGGWWFRFCHEANLNGKYYTDIMSVITWGQASYDDAPDGVVWKPWKGERYSLKQATMMIRRTG